MSTISTPRNNNMDKEALTPVKVLESSEKGKHKIIFNIAAFSIDSNNNPIDADMHQKLTRKVLSQHRYDQIVEVVSNWKTDEELTTVSDDEREAYDKWKSAIKRINGKSIYSWHKEYAVEEVQVPGSPPKKILKRLEPIRVPEKQQRPDTRIVLPITEMFDAIHESHDKLGHMGQDSTWTDVAMKYYGISQTLVTIFCKNCRGCLRKQPSIHPHKGAKKPIHSTNFRDRFQVDLIDFRKFARRDIYGVMQSWILVLKDHFSGLTYITSIPRKRPKYVACKLNEIFGFIGYPFVFHTDNGKEFTGKAIIAMLRDLNPHILTVTGRPRTPRDQGSVEVTNKLVKSVLFGLLGDMKSKGKDPDWIALLPRVMSIVNSNQSRGKNSVSAYETVFGLPYHQEISCSVQEAHQIFTVEERLKVTGDDRMATVAQDLFHVTKENDQQVEVVSKDAGKEEDDGYWSDDSAPLEKPLDLDEDEDMLENDDKQAAPDNTVATFTVAKYIAAAAVAAAAAAVSPAKTTLAKDEVTKIAMLSVENEGDSLVDTSMTAAQKTKDVSMLSPPQVFTTTQTLKLSEEARAWTNGLDIDLTQVPAIPWSYKMRINDKEVKVTNTCPIDSILQGFFLLATYDDELSSDITSDAQLCRVVDMIGRGEYDTARHVWIQHCERVNRGPSKVTKTRSQWNCWGGVQYYTDPLPNLFKITYRLYFDTCSSGEFDCENTMYYNPSDIESEDQSAYALKDRHGRHLPIFPSHLCQIEAHINSTHNVGVQVDCGEESSKKRSVSDENKNKCDGKRLKRKVLEHPMPPLLCLENVFFKEKNINTENRITELTSIDQLAHIIVINGQKYKLVYIILANASHFCSITTIAGRHLLYDGMLTPKLRWVDPSILEGLPFKVSQLWYRKAYDYESPARESASNDDAKNTRDGEQDDVSDNVGDYEQNTPSASRTPPTTNLPSNSTLPSSTGSKREAAVLKRRAHKKRQAEKMVSTHIKHLTDMGVDIGAVVTVQVDRRDVNTHAQGIMGIVCAVSNFGGVQVVSEHGLLVNGSGKIDYWIPSDKYKLQYKPTQSANISDALETIRGQIIGKTFDINDAKKISLPKAHMLIVGASSPCKKGNCGCARGMCTKRCGCRSGRPPRACSSSCSCNGNCKTNPLNDCNVRSD